MMSSDWRKSAIRSGTCAAAIAATLCGKRVRRRAQCEAKRARRCAWGAPQRSAWSAVSVQVRPARQRLDTASGPYNGKASEDGRFTARALRPDLMADADVRVEWLEPPGAGSGSFKPLSARGVRVSVALADASGLPVLVLGLKPREARARLHRAARQRSG